MPWFNFQNSDAENLRDFIAAREYCCMNFASSFKKRYFANFMPGMLSQNHFKIVLHRARQTGSIDYAVMLSQSGQLFPAADYSGSSVADIREGLTLLKDSLESVNTVMGDKRSVEKILGSFFSKKAVTEGNNSFSYYAMVLNPENYKPCGNNSNGITVRLATHEDFAALVPLQEYYEIEEVLPSPDMFSSYASRQQLASILKEQTTVVAEKSGRIIARANTNGNGFLHGQIGGVYTLPEYRGMGISTSVVSFLAAKILANKFRPSLFVKVSNKAAISVYNKLGFRKMTEFQITYFM